jgi:hypothetical protein
MIFGFSEAYGREQFHRRGGAGERRELQKPEDADISSLRALRLDLMHCRERFPVNQIRMLES